MVFFVLFLSKHVSDVKISFDPEEHPAPSEKTERLLVFRPRQTSLSSFFPQREPGDGSRVDGVRKMVLSYGRGWR